MVHTTHTKTHTHVLPTFSYHLCNDGLMFSSTQHGRHMASKTSHLSTCQLQISSAHTFRTHTLTRQGERLTKKKDKNEDFTLCLLKTILSQSEPISFHNTFYLSAATLLQSFASASCCQFLHWYREEKVEEQQVLGVFSPQ